MKILIRKAEEEDCSRLMELVNELAVYEKAPEEVTVIIDDFTNSGFGPTPIWWAFVAEVDGVVQGFALYYIRFSTWKGERLYLEDFIVNEAFRGFGVGKLLFDELITEAKRKKFTGIVWQVLDWNEPAIIFYKKLDAIFLNEWLTCRLNQSQLKEYSFD